MVTKQQSQPAQCPPAGSNSGQTAPNPSIMICRNKHYPYIASYHGPWLSLPVELLQSLFALNNDTTTAPPPSPIDPTIFRNLITIRTLVDDASEMVIKAAGGQNMRGNTNMNSLGIPYNARDYSPAGGRMSAIRQHRLRELAVSKLAAAYRCDEIATSVLTMQSASALDDVAAKVLKRDPQNSDALYVHHFHEKIPSRMLASSTDCKTLDTLIASYPNTPEFYRTRAMIHSFREEFPAALRDFKTAISLAKKRKRTVNGVDCGAVVHTSNGNDPLQSPSKALEHLLQQQRQQFSQQQQQEVHFESDQEDACSEATLYFLRAACFHQYAIHLIDKGIDKVNDSYLSEKRKKKNKKKKKSRSASATKINDGTTPTDSTPPMESQVEQPVPAPATNKNTIMKDNATTATVPSASSTAPPTPLPTWNEYKDAMQPSAQLIENLARRSIRDYHHFLSYYPNSLEPFIPAGMPAGLSSSASSSPTQSNDQISDALVPHGHHQRYENGDADAVAIATMPAFISSITPKSLTKLSCPSMGAVGNGGALGSTTCPQHSYQNHHHHHPHAQMDLGVVTRTMGPHSLTHQHHHQFNTNNTHYQNYNSHNQHPQEPLTTLGTYHPLLLEAWFSIGVNYMLTRDWRTTAQWHDRIPYLQDQVEGYPVFLPARSMSQADYIEILTLLRKAARERTGGSGAATGGGTQQQGQKQTNGQQQQQQQRQNGTSDATATTTPALHQQQQLVNTNNNYTSCDCRAHALSSSSSSPTTSKQQPQHRPEAGTTHTTPNSTLKQYPLHTKRAQTVSMWLQAMAMADREAVATKVSKTLDSQLGHVQDQIKHLEDRKRELLAVRKLKMDQLVLG
ncbi:hypothetical protein DFJ77DRAFT_215429 [Powellomyces hirtus]|nr:hypothetical protein DFJ77DRAFT_215429 [Powellomyces hirtus]